MRLIFFSFLISTFCFGQNPFQVPKEEIGKTGVYTVEQPGVPIHKDYDEIYRHNHGRKLKLAPGGKFYQLQFEKAKFKLVVPETYSPQNPAGIIFIDTRNSEFHPNLVDTTLNYLNEYAKQKNFICVLIDTKEPTLKQRDTGGLDLGHEYAVIVRRSIDIVKERYSIDSDRVLTFSNYSVDQVFMTTVCCPHVFKHNAFTGTPMFFYDNMPSAKGGKPIPSFGAQDEAIKTMKEAAQNTYAFFHVYLSDDKNLLQSEKKLNEDSEKIFTRNKFNKASFFNISYKGVLKDKIDIKDLEIFDNQYLLMIAALDKIDPKPFNAKIYLEQAQNFEKKNNFPKAFENYKIAAKYGFEEAVTKYEEMNKELQDSSTSMMKLHLAKNYPEAYNLAQTILKKFGSTSNAQAANLYKTYSRDKKIILEIKAASFLAKAEAALKQSPVPVDKIKAACEKVIQTVPGTVTAEKAKTILEKIK